MKKILLILLAAAAMLGCDDIDETVDISVMPPATTHGANTFGCLYHDWLEVGGRYPGFDVIYYKPSNLLVVSVNTVSTVRFKILSPAAGQEVAITDIRVGNAELPDGTMHITRFDTDVISGTFANGAELTNGRLDAHYLSLNDTIPAPYPCLTYPDTLACASCSTKQS
jgi:hypothetical protein